MTTMKSIGRMVYVDSVANNTNISVAVDIVETSPLISDDLRPWLESLFVCLMIAFSILGVVTNLINIRVFIRQGLSSDSSTVGLFALAISDFFGCAFLVPTVACEVLKYKETPYHAASCVSVFVSFFFLPHSVMSRITTWITVYIGIERSLCVLFPFKVKTLLRPTVTTISMVMIYTVIICIYLPIYPFYGFEWLYYGGSNSTNASRVRILKLRGDGFEVARFHGILFSMVLPNIAFIITSITTGLMLHKLKQYSKWRSNTTAPATGKEQQDGKGKKDIEILKTVVMATGLFFFCLSMSLFPGFAFLVIPGFNYSGLNSNAFYVFYFYKFLFDAINSSLNFFFYIRVSSRYKTAFNEVFRTKVA